MEATRPQFICQLLGRAQFKLGKGQLQAVYEILRRALVAGLYPLALVRGFQLNAKAVRLPHDDSLISSLMAVNAMSSAATEVDRGNLQGGADQIEFALEVVRRLAQRGGKLLREPSELTLKRQEV